MGISNLYGEYAANKARIDTLKAQVKEIETMQDQLEPHIIEMMIADGMGKAEFAFGKFTVYPTKKWTYPEEVVQMGEEFKTAKAKAESTGEATFEETNSLRYTPTKL